jgi:hypothetical protein
MKQTMQSIAVGAVGLVSTVLGVTFRTCAKDWSMEVISRQGPVSQMRQDFGRTALFTEVGLALLLIGVALVLASVLSLLVRQRNETNAAF